MASILFIDDDLGSRILFEKACLLLGHHPFLASSGMQGLAIADERQPDLIMLDLSLPDLDGMVILSELHQGLSTAHIPVVIVSAGVTEQDENISKANGAVAYLNKPVSLSTLQTAIDQFTSP